MNSKKTKITVRHLLKTFDWNLLFNFFMQHGVNEYNWYSEPKLKEHLQDISTGKTEIWAAFHEDKLVGFITATKGGQFSLMTHHTERPTFEIGEFVVDSGYRNQGIGTKLTRTIRKELFEIYNSEQVVDFYVMVHAQNNASLKCFKQAGFQEVITYVDPYRNRSTTVSKVSRPTRVIGIQSGNAVDGIDICIVDFHEPVLKDIDSREISQLNYNVLAYEVIPWQEEDRELILNLRDGKKPVIDYVKANHHIAGNFCNAIIKALKLNNIKKSSIDLISSHGQSIFGHPHWELGELSVLAHRLGITTIGDFRQTDIAAGGNGSPCTCSFDTFMLRSEIDDQWRICINIGGTTSVTFCPPLNSPESPKGLDPGIGVFYMDLNAQRINHELEYDNGGKIAQAGKTNETMLLEMLQHPHFQKTELPISIGTEDFPRSLFQDWLRRSVELGLSDNDFQATLTELTARSISLACKRFTPTKKIADIIVRGKVKKNNYFMERLLVNLRNILQTDIKSLKSLDDLGIDEESWETVMYAMFGFLGIKGLYNFIPSCTGASSHVIGGKICPGDNYSSLFLSKK